VSGTAVTGSAVDGAPGVGEPDGVRTTPLVVPPLDPVFRPATLARRTIEAAARAAGGVAVHLAVEQPNGSGYGRETVVFGDGHVAAPASYLTCERLLKFL